MRESTSFISACFVDDGENLLLEIQNRQKGININLPMDTTYTHTLRDCALILYPGSENRSEYQLIKVIQWYLHKLYFTSFTRVVYYLVNC